jgi:hypothetical protein
MSQYTERLKRMQKAVDEQMTDYVPGGFSLVPEGEYSFRVQATLDETKKEPKRLTVTWQFTVAEGDNEGQKVFNRTIIEDNKVGLQICRGRVEDLGYEWPEKVVDLEALLEEISANPPLVRGRVTHEESRNAESGKEYTNARIRILDVLETSGQADAQPTDSDAGGTPEEAQESPDRAAMLALCGSFGFLEVNDEMTVGEIVKALKSADVRFPEKDLQPEELELLERVEAELVERPVAPPPRQLRTPPKPQTRTQAPSKRAEATSHRGKR